MTKRILTVEDQDDLRAILRDCLTAAGYTVIEAVDGADHRGAILPHLRTMVPGVVRGLELAETRRVLARREVAELVANVTARFDAVDQVMLGRDRGLDAVAASARARKCRRLR